MMFEGFSKKLETVLQRFRSRGGLGSEEVDLALKEIRLALLEADVHFKVVKSFIESVRIRAVGAEVSESLTPGQQVIKIVWEELSNLMGQKGAIPLPVRETPEIVMLVGLQGAGKTTTVGKLGAFYKKQGKRVLLVAADLKRAAAVDQLQSLGKKIDVSVLIPLPNEHPVALVKRAVHFAKEKAYDKLLIDTAGRLQIDDAMMEELVEMKTSASPHEIWLVADAMTGQVAVNLADLFHKKLSLTGAILTKTEGDARGGAVLSIRSVTQVPIQFIGTGEQIEALEPFYPDRIASRILGMGDVLSLIELTEQNYSKEHAQQLQKKVRSNQFTLEDFRDQMKQMKKMGGLEKILEMIPGIKKVKPDMEQLGKEMKGIEAILSSMTAQERQDPGIINASRRKRIAKGSGTTIQEINRLTKQFYEAKKMLKRFSGGKKFGFGNGLE